MNITPETMYWITRLDGINDFTAVLAVLLVASAFMVSFAWYCIYEKSGSTGVVLSTIMLLVAVLLGVANTLIPTTKEMCAIIAIPKIANSETVQGLGNDIVGLAKEWIVELKPNKKVATK